MADTIPSVSTDQVAALVELARAGSLRAAAAGLHITEQGLRNRLVALEAHLKVALYHKQRGPRRRSPLTPQGEQFLPQAQAFLESARRLGAVFGGPVGQQEVHVTATQYLTLYAMLDAIKGFHRAFPNIRVRLSTRTERDIEEALLRDPDLAFGVAAPYEGGSGLEYMHLFSLNWGLITPPGHALLKKRGLSLADLVGVPLIVFERGSTGRQHVLNGFYKRGLSPRIDMEATTTGIVVKMVEAGLGVSLVPLVPNGIVTRGLKIGVRWLPALDGQPQIAPIDSGILIRRGETPQPAAEAFIRFLMPREPTGAERPRAGTL
jgi:DNA-binding transcriptional LysR family regulator